MAPVEQGSRLRKVLEGFILRSTPQCQTIAFWTSLGMDGSLPVGIRVSSYLHRLGCDFCRNYQEHLHRIRDVSHEFELNLDELHDDGLPAEARARIKEAILQNS